MVHTCPNIGSIICESVHDDDDDGDDDWLNKTSLVMNRVGLAQWIMPSLNLSFILTEEDAYTFKVSMKYFVKSKVVKVATVHI